MVKSRSIQEREVENILEQKLKEKGYVYDIGLENRNVYMQQPRTSEEVNLLQGLRPDYLIYLDNESTKPNVIIEVKKPNMNLENTLQQGLKYAKFLKSEIVIIYDGINLKSFRVDGCENLKIDGVEIKDICSIDIYKKFVNEKTANLKYGSKINIQSKQELITVFDYANNKLRKAGIQQGIERFTEFSNLLFLKLISETNDVISESIPEHIKWNHYKKFEGESLYSYINNIVIKHLEQLFNRKQQSILFSKLLIKDNKLLKQIIDKLDKLELSKIETDIKGDAFEYFIQKYNSANKDLGEYFTPRHIVSFLVDLAKPKYPEKIYDPFCGTGGMLISAFNYIYSELQKQEILTNTTLNDLREKTLFGSEISSTSKIAKMNMILTGDGHTNITQQDTLKNPITEKYDVVITNIPFNLSSETNDLYYSLGCTDGNSQCIEHIIKSLNKNNKSRAFVIVPEGFLNNTESKNTRKFLIQNNLLKGIISLPSGVFLPYTDAKTSILELKGFDCEPVEKVYYYKVKNDGHTLTTRRRKINGINDLDEFLSLGDNIYNKHIKYGDIIKNINYSFMYFKYDIAIPKNYISLNKVIRETNIKNTNNYSTQTITTKEFYGIAMGEKYWGDNFVSVTSKTNTNYKVIKNNQFAYNPSRINVGSLGINISDNNLAVSSAYTTFEVYNNDFLPEYIYHYLRSNEGMEEIKTRCFGSVRQALRFEDLSKIFIPIISKQKQIIVCQDAHSRYLDYIKSKRKLEQFDINCYFETDSQ